jgi:hypothetical protein
VWNALNNGKQHDIHIIMMHRCWLAYFCNYRTMMTYVCFSMLKTMATSQTPWVANIFHPRLLNPIAMDFAYDLKKVMNVS